jgi:hypothetical protein
MPGGQSALAQSGLCQLPVVHIVTAARTPHTCVHMGRACCCMMPTAGLLGTVTGSPPALLISTSRGRPESSHCAAAARTLLRSARSRLQVSMTAPGTSPLRTAVQSVTSYKQGCRDDGAGGRQPPRLSDAQSFPHANGQLATATSCRCAWAQGGLVGIAWEVEAYAH